jgi:YYY domain-containing protein
MTPGLIAASVPGLDLAAETAPRRLSPLAAGAGRVRGWLARQDPTAWLLVAIGLLSLLPRLYGLNWDANNHLHPDEREIVFRAICLSLPGTPRAAGCDPATSGPGWLLSPLSPLNPHFFAYGSFPLYLLAAVAHGLAWLTQLTHGAFHPPDGGAWDDFNHFTLVGRTLSALFDAGSVVLAGLLARRLAGRWAGVLAAAFVATIPFEVQVAHFYAVDTLLLFFILLTLYGCVLLAQGPRGPQAEERGMLRPWGMGMFVGASFGLAMATKVSALPLLAPIAVALVLRWRRRGLDEMALALLGVASAAVLAFVLTSPYALIDWGSFQAQVNEQTALSRGQLDYPYVRQFANTTPFVYEIQQLLLYDMGLPLGLLGLAGFGWAVARLWRRLDDDWLIVVVWLVGYFTIIGSAYTKFTRYMLPVFAPLAVCGAAALAALAAWGTWQLVRAGTGPRPDEAPARGWERLVRGMFAGGIARQFTRLWGTGWWRAASVGLGLVILACSTFFTLALVNIYSTPNTRVQASEWIYNHIPSGATLTNEVWDDPLPVWVPPAHTAGGVAYTAAGNVINPARYGEIGLNLYDPDTPQKAQQLAQQLAAANVVVISSQRLVRSIPKLPDRYPMTTRYYQLLFAGKLGFTLAAHFTNAPHLFGVVFNDTGADESYSVYDHPPVWIFVRSGAGLSASAIQSELTSGLTLPAVSTRAGNQKSLLLPPADAAADAQAQPLGVQFPADSLPNRVPVLWWLVIVELLGLAAFPLVYLAFPGLRDRGWGLSKIAGVLLLGYLTWLPASLRVLPFDHWVVVAVFALLVAVGAALAWRRRAELAAFFREHWRLLAICEAAFLVAFLYFTWVRALDPDLWHIYRGGEKPMELAFLNAILRSRYLPPYDPWFSGGYINYYYYGQYLVAVLVKLTGIAPTTAFNLAIPLLFGMTFSAAYTVVAGLVGRWWAGLAGGISLVVIANLDGLRQLVGQWRALLAHQPVPLFDYWASSRVIPYTINEFPYWSFLYADLHAHLIDLPITVLIIAGCASLLASASRPGWRSAAGTLAWLALALGAAWCTSTWDVPTYALLIVVTLALRLVVVHTHDKRESWRGWLSWRLFRPYLLALALTFAATYVLYLPFHATFQNFVSGVGTVTTPTDPTQFVLLFGIWLFLLASYFFLELRDDIEERLVSTGAALPEGSTRRLWLLLAGSALALLAVFSLGLKALLLLLIVVGLYLALTRRHTPLTLVTYTLLLLGLCVAFGVELIYIRDFLDNSPWERMNTVFKFYYQVWTFFALGGALAFTQIAARLAAGGEPEAATDGAAAEPEATGSAARVWSYTTGGRGVLRTLWVVTLVLLVAGSSVFLVEGTEARVQDPQIWAQVQPPPGGIQPQGLSLDGMAYMRGWYPGDYAAINWLNTHVGGDPVIVEASNGNYQWYSRVSIYTGLPDVLGWGNREYEQRYGNEVFPRQNDVQTFWATGDPNAALAFLHEYHVHYVYLGQLERTCYVTQPDNTCVPLPPVALAKFATLQRAGALRVVYQNSGVTIYEVTG